MKRHWVLFGICWAVAPHLVGGINRWTASGPPDQVYGFATSPPSTIYAGTPSGVFQSNDHGRNWTLIHSNSAGLGGTLSEIAVDPVTPTTLYGSRAAPDLPSVVKSIDGGRTWFPSDAGLRPFTFLRIVVDPTNPSTLYGGGTLGVFKSEDGGSTWSLVSTGVPWVSSLAIDPEDTRRLYAASFNGPVFKTSDGGMTWSQMFDAVGEAKVDVDLDPSDPSKLYVAAYCCATIWKSLNFGSDWEQLRATPTLIETILIDPSNPRTIYTGGSGGPVPTTAPPTRGGVFRSSDEGRTWTAFNREIEYQVIRRLGSDPTGKFLVAVPSSTAGTFVYEIQAEDVPTLSGIGLAIFVVSLVGTAVLLLSRRTAG